MESDSETPPRLTIICSSPTGQERIDGAAIALLGRMPPELAAKLARTTITFALDSTRHAAFAQGLGDLGGAEDVTGRLAAERIRQRADRAEILTIIVIALDQSHRVPNDSQLLGHELGHVACGHTHEQLVTASADELSQREREADAFAARYQPEW